jgi:hypothetical protein
MPLTACLNHTVSRLTAATDWRWVNQRARHPRGKV